MSKIDLMITNLQGQWEVSRSSDDPLDEPLIQQGDTITLGKRSHGLVPISWQRSDTDIVRPFPPTPAQCWVEDYDVVLKGFLHAKDSPFSISFARISPIIDSSDHTARMFGMIRLETTKDTADSRYVVWSAAHQGGRRLTLKQDPEKWLKRHQRPSSDWIGRVFKVVACSGGNPHVRSGYRILIFADEDGKFDIMSTSEMSTSEPGESTGHHWTIYDTNMEYDSATSTLHNDHRAIAYVPGRNSEEPDRIYAMYDKTKTDKTKTDKTKTDKTKTDKFLFFENDADEGVWGAEEGGG